MTWPDRTWRALAIALLVAAPAAGQDDRPRPLPGARAAAQPPAASEGSLEYDPWQGFNRKIFAFNDALDRWVLEPTAKGWDFITPDPVQRSIGNFFGNLRMPIDLVNNLLQGKGVEGAKTLGRFTVNTTAGVAGFFDPASRIGLGPETEDFGQTLGLWGVPAGPYLVLPVLGPSSVRDTGGLGVDGATAITPFFVDTWILAAARVFDSVNVRARYLDEVAEAKAASLDYYTFVRNAFLQRRRAEIEDRTQLTSPEERPPYDDSELYTIP